jgi:SAM-dependent methyltransferase
LDDPKSIVRRGYDLVSRAYRADDATEGEYADWLEQLESRLAPGSRVLDLGCGCGIPAARRLARHYDVTGVDISPVQIARARELVPHARFVCADMTTMQFDDASFHAIACLYALIHLPLAEQPVLLQKIGAWLRPGGVLIATVGHRAWMGVEKNWLGVEGGDMWWSHADVGTYRRWLAAAGLRLELENFVPEGNGGHTFLLAVR